MSGRRASLKDARCDRLLIVSILDLSGIDRAGIFTSIGLVRQVTDAVSDQTLLKKNIAFEVTEEDHLSIALCRPGAGADAPLGEGIIPVSILGPPNASPIDRWFAVKLQEDSSINGAETKWARIHVALEYRDNTGTTPLEYPRENLEARDVAWETRSVSDEESPTQADGTLAAAGAKDEHV